MIITLFAIPFSISLAIIFSILFAIQFAIQFIIPFANTIRWLLLNIGSIIEQETHNTPLMWSFSSPSVISVRIRKEDKPFARYGIDAFSVVDQMSALLRASLHYVAGELATFFTEHCSKHSHTKFEILRTLSFQLDIRAM